MSNYAIVGFGAAGFSAAREIRRLEPAAVIDVYSDTEPAPANPMLTTYFVKGAIPYSAMFPFGEQDAIREELKLNIHSNTPVTGIEPDTKTLRLADGSGKQYDRILISTGSSALMPPIPGLELPGVVKMRTAEDAVRLKELLDSGTVKSGLVIGASWVGIKVVEDLAAKNIPCTLVDGAKWMFYVAAFEETARRAQRDLENKGIRVACGQMLSRIEREADGRLTAVMQSGERFTADLIAACIGVRMNVGFLKDSGIGLNRGVIVDSRMRTDREGIYAAGDCCEAPDIQSGTHRNIGLWYNACRQGRVAGSNMAGVPAEFGGNVPVNLAHYMDYDFMSIGDVSSCTDTDEVYEYEDGRYYIRAVRSGDSIKCINIIGSAESNGAIRNIFIKRIENGAAAPDVRTVCFLQEQGYPNSFINFLGGTSID